MKTAVLVLLTACLPALSPAARADVTMRVTETAEGVEVAVTGSIDLSSLTLFTADSEAQFTAITGVNRFGSSNIAAGVTPDQINRFLLSHVDVVFVECACQRLTNTFSGPFFIIGVDPGNQRTTISLPTDYVSGSPIDSTAIYATATFDELGLVPGTYVFDQVTLIIGEASQPGTLAIDPATLTVNEADGTASITVTRTGGSDGAVSATIDTADGTATAGADYTAIVGGSVDFADGDSAAKTILVDIIDDTDVEGDETFTVSLSAPTGGASLGTDTGTVTIKDNDVAPPPPAIEIAIEERIRVNDDNTQALAAIFIVVEETLRVVDAVTNLPALEILVTEAIRVVDTPVAETSGFVPGSDLIDIDIPNPPLFPGDTFFASANGWQPFSIVQAFLESTPVLVGEQSADASGAVNFQITVPQNFPSGQHTLALVGVAPDNSPRRLTSPIVIHARAAAGGPAVPVPVSGLGHWSGWVLLALMLCAGWRFTRRSTPARR